MPRHFTNVQALRGIACLMVVLGHVGALEKEFGVRTLVLREVHSFGFAGVDLFFVISGFIIASTNRGKRGLANVPTYLFRRCWRIYPMYWVALGVAALVSLSIWGFTNLRPASAWPAWIALYPWEPANSVLGQAWTLNYEVMFYLAFAAILVLPARAGAALLGVWGISIAMASLAFPVPTNLLAAHAASPFVLEFLAGCVIAWLSGRGLTAGGATAVAAGIGYGLIAAWVADTSSDQPWDMIMYPQRDRVAVFGPAAALIVYGFVALEGRLKPPRWLLACGDASYSLYLLHGTVLLLAHMAGYYVEHTRVPHFLWLTGAFAASMALGLLVHRCVERPLLNMWRTKKPRPVPVVEPLRIAA